MPTHAIEKPPCATATRHASAKKLLAVANAHDRRVDRAQHRIVARQACDALLGLLAIGERVAHDVFAVPRSHETPEASLIA